MKIIFNRLPRYNWKIVESGIKHHTRPPPYSTVLWLKLLSIGEKRELPNKKKCFFDDQLHVM